MKSSARVLLLSILMLFTTAGAATYTVPGDFEHIQAAIDFASNSDTIVVSPGVHKNNLDFNGKDLVLKSEHGAALTNLRPAVDGQAIIRLHSSETNAAVIEGFTFSHAGGASGYPFVYQAIWLDNAAPIIRSNIFTNCGSGGTDQNVIYARRNSPAIVTGNLFYDNPDAYCNVWTSSTTGITVTNNTVHSGLRGIVMTRDGFDVQNNTFSDCGINVSMSATGTFDYNNDWQSTKANISVDPMFVDPSSGLFELQPGSGLIDQGNPNVSYNDTDGTRNDIGAFPFDQRRASVYNLNTGDDPAHVGSTTPTLYWSYYDSSQAQNQFEVEVGTDGDWSVAELWQPGTIMTSDTELVYAGTALSPNDIVYWRIRAHNGSQWGAWKQHVFRINQPPSTPTPIAPADGGSASVVGVRLTTENSTSAFNDDLTYDFGIYSDAGLTSLVAFDSNVVEMAINTHSQKFTNLVAGNQYWWRVRAFDGFEYSNWSTASMFEVREPSTIFVPNQYPTIQAGINQAMELDTVSVAAGVYTGDGNRDLNFNGVNIVLRSQSGPSATVIDCGSDVDGPHPCLVLDNHEDTASMLQGFTITNAENDDGYYFGAVTIFEGGLTIRDCVFDDNTGAGLTAQAGNYDSIPNVRVVNCTFRNNEIHGLFLANANAEIDSCVFKENVGRGMEAAGWQSLSITNSLFLRNQYDGLYMWTGFPANLTVTGNTFVGNEAGLHFYWEPPKSGELTPASSVTGEGFTRNVAAYNTTNGIWGDGLGFGDPVTCNNAYGNGEGDFEGWSIGPDDENGNISAPPLFCDTTADYFAIASGSPCAPANNSCGVLMGAFAVDPACESRCCVGLTGNVNQDPDGIVNLTDLTVLINNLFVTFQTLDCPAAANTSGDATCQINLTDITVLVNRLFVTFEPTAACLPQCE